MNREKNCYSCKHRRMWMGTHNVHIACNHDKVIRMNITPDNCEACEYYKSDEEENENE